MKRLIYKKLLIWKEQNSNKPLVLQGARQVGKTYILKKFAKTEFSNFLYINFEEDIKIHNAFNESLSPKIILSLIELYLGTKYNWSKTLIIFDEIQTCPNALNSLKYFSESDEKYYIVSAGSLLGVKFNQRGSFPVGKVSFLYLYPMTFFEFLEATSNNQLLEYIEGWNCNSVIPEIIHKKLIDLLKVYIYVGGMPEVVKKYISSNEDLLDVREVQKNIETSYLLDFIKHAPPIHVQKITKIWEQIPLELSKENKKFIFSNIRKSSRAREFEIAMQWLYDAGLIYYSRNIKKPFFPLEAYTDKSFKLFLLDTGILGRISNMPTKNIFFKGSLFFAEFKGALVENYVAQTLKSAEDLNLYYWTSSGIAEVDFIFQHEDGIYPLEVKSGCSNKAKSLRVYSNKYSPSLILRTNMNNFNNDNKYINIPLYMLERLRDIIQQNV